MLSDVGPKPIMLEKYDNGRIIDITHAYRADMMEWMSADSIGKVVSLRESMANG
jgi:hypothetical protein